MAVSPIVHWYLKDRVRVSPRRKAHEHFELGRKSILEEMRKHDLGRLVMVTYADSSGEFHEKLMLINHLILTRDESFAKFCKDNDVRAIYKAIEYSGELT